MPCQDAFVLRLSGQDPCVVMIYVLRGIYREFASICESFVIQYYTNIHMSCHPNNSFNSFNRSEADIKEDFVVIWQDWGRSGEWWRASLLLQISTHSEFASVINLDFLSAVSQIHHLLHIKTWYPAPGPS